MSGARLVTLRVTESRGGEEGMITILVDQVGAVLDRRGSGCLLRVQGEPFYCGSGYVTVTETLRAAGWGGGVRVENKGMPK